MSSRAVQKHVGRRPAAIDYASLLELVLLEADIEQWLSRQPDMGKEQLCAKLRKEKGLRVKPKVAEAYLSRLRKVATTSPGGLWAMAADAQCVAPSTQLYRDEKGWAIASSDACASSGQEAYVVRLSPHDSDDDLEFCFAPAMHVSPISPES